VRTMIYNGLSIPHPPQPSLYPSPLTAAARFRFLVHRLTFNFLILAERVSGGPISSTILNLNLYCSSSIFDNPPFNRHLPVCLATQFFLPSFRVLRSQPTTGPNPAPRASARTNLVTERIPHGLTLLSYVHLVPHISLPASQLHQNAVSTDVLSDITSAAGWEILNCDSKSTDPQDIRLVCVDKAKGCSQLFSGGVENTIVRLPEDCAGMCIPCVWCPVLTPLLARWSICSCRQDLG